MHCEALLVGSLQKLIDSITGRFQIGIYSAPPSHLSGKTGCVIFGYAAECTIPSAVNKAEGSERTKDVAMEGLSTNNKAAGRTEGERKREEGCCLLSSGTRKLWASLIIPLWVFSRALISPAYSVRWLSWRCQCISPVLPDLFWISDLLAAVVSKCK